MSLTLPESWDSALIVGRTPWGVPSGPRDALVPLFARGIRRSQRPASRPGANCGPGCGPASKHHSLTRARPESPCLHILRYVDFACAVDSSECKLKE